MNGKNLTEKQLKAAEKYILLRRASENKAAPGDDQYVQLRWKELVMLVAEYGALRASGVERGGSISEPGDVYLTAQERI